ncbi:hypothetical protein G7Y79_00015g037850 [Physcia stellaris]|nr:hypothetical protein G7Y79_00015g037850 [Physcia stellaris]
MFAFFENLHIDLSVAIEKRENFDATIDRETISVQNIDFFDISIDEKNDTFFERSRTISDANIEKNKNFDDVEDEKIIDRDDEKDDEIIDCFETNFDSEICAKIFDFFA